MGGCIVSSGLARLRADIYDTIKDSLPPQFFVSDHHGTFGEPEIKNYGARAPAVILTVNGGKSLRRGGSIYVDLACSAFILTRAGVDDRTDAALATYEKLLHTLHTTDWGVGNDETREYKTPFDIEASNLYGDMLDRQQIALWGVKWTQTVCLPPLVAVTSFDDFLMLFATNANARPTELAADTSASEQQIEPEQ